MTYEHRLGTYIKGSVAGEHYQAFVPPALPPMPPLDMGRLGPLLTKAASVLGRLDGVSMVMPDKQLMLYYYVRKEAVLSSQIEGTQSSLSDLLRHESQASVSVPLDDVAEVSAYVAALEHGLSRIRDGFPLSLRLIREMHHVLLAKGRGAHKQPGEFRSIQNWIRGTRPGNARFVPPPPELLMGCLDTFEKYCHQVERPYSSIIDAGLIHVQFETIHPFLDGNGRIGRLLITFFLIIMGDLKAPWLYLSLFFKNNRTVYYDKLMAVREKGDWEGWLEFFLHGVIYTAEQVIETSQRIAELLTVDRQKVEAVGRGQTAVQMYALLCEKAMITVKAAAQSLDVSEPTARHALNALQNLGIVTDIKGQAKARVYVYSALVALLEEGTSPIGFP